MRKAFVQWGAEIREHLSDIGTPVARAPEHSICVLCVGLLYHPLGDRAACGRCIIQGGKKKITENGIVTFSRFLINL